MEVVRIRLCFLTAGAYAARHMARHMGHPPEWAPDGTHKSGCPICYQPKSGCPICYQPKVGVGGVCLTGSRRPRRPVAQTSSTQARIRWCAMAMGPGTFSVECSPASARRASSRGNQRTSAISTGSMRMSVVSASP